MAWLRTSALLLSFLPAISSAFPQTTPHINLRLPDIPLHDPWILADQPTRTYFLYTSARSAAGKGPAILAYHSQDLQTWSGPYEVFHVPTGSWANPAEGPWAPEVHPYRGRYYLFTTLHNSHTALPLKPDANANPSKGTHISVTYNGVGPHLRGTEVFVADSPDGPFLPIADKPIPPQDSMTLDGTLYVEDGIPYMVYAHEWTQLIDGTLEAIAMNQDLSASVGTPIYLFKASDAPWLADRTVTTNEPGNYVTDGPELYRTHSGKLLMLWSSYQDGSYVEAVAHSVSNKLRGPWKQDGILVGGDSGHGMLFHTFDGHLKLILHHPFAYPQSRGVLYDIDDTGDTIRLKR